VSISDGKWDKRTVPLSHICLPEKLCYTETPLVFATLNRYNESNGSIPLLCTTATGTLFQISSNLQLSTVRNGSFYNIDQGIEPDVPLLWPESFYDREALVEYLHTLK